MHKTKYKFVETQGCTAFSFTINGKDVVDVPKEKQKEIVDYLCEKMKEGIQNDTIQLKDVVSVFQATDWGSENEQCDQCYDTVHWDIWEI